MPNAIVSNKQVWLVHNDYLIGEHTVTNKRSNIKYRYGRIQIRDIRLDANQIGKRVKINIEIISNKEENKDGKHGKEINTGRGIEHTGKQTTFKGTNNISTASGRLFS